MENNQTSQKINRKKKDLVSLVFNIFAIGALILGILSWALGIFTFFFFFLITGPEGAAMATIFFAATFLASFLGLISGILGLISKRKKIALVGLILCVILLAIIVIWVW